MIDDKEMRDAWDRIARSADGHTIYLHLQKRLMAICVSGDDSTLRGDNGERMFAAKLIGLMAKGIEESASGLSARCITFASPVARSVSRAGRGAGRRINDDTIVPGYNDDPEPSASSSGT